jgi:hypothetical protein
VLTEGNKEEDILERCLAAMQQGHALEECLASYPAQHETLEPLLRLAIRLNSARSLQASPQFQAAAPLRLHMQIADQLKPRQDGTRLQVPPSGQSIRCKAPQHLHKASPRLGRAMLAQIFVALLLLLLIISGVGKAAASAQVLPGDFLYPIKRAQENLQLTISLNSASQAHLRLEFANRRINEAIVLIQKNRPSAIDQVLADYNNQIQFELKFIEKESSLSHTERSELANMLLSDLTDHETMLESMIKEAPESAKANIETALIATQGAHAQVLDVIRNQKDNGGNQALPVTLPAYSSPTPPPTKTPTLTPVPPDHTPTPNNQPHSGIFPNPTRIPWVTRIPSASPPANRATPPSRNILTPWPKPTWQVTPPRGSIRTPVWPRPTPWPMPTHPTIPKSRVTPTKQASFSDVANPTP